MAHMLIQHPQVQFGANGKKEQKVLHNGAATGLDPKERDRYLALFDGGGTHRLGEWTPAYMRCLWCIPVVATMTDGPVLAIIRDPVVRFESAMNQAQRVGLATKRWASFAAEALWAGMYASQLEVWTTALGERLIVLQYEQVVAAPERWVNRVWRAMGLEPVPLELASQAPREYGWSLDGAMPEMRRWLADMYAADAAKLERWGVDLSLWKSLEDSLVHM
jgi:hypothetical protein